MTQEQIVRQMLQGFVDDPPDSDFQYGFLAATLVIANEVMGIEFGDKLLRAVEGLAGADRKDVKEAVTKARVLLTVIEGGKSTCST